MAFDKTKPAGSTPLKTADDQIRANFEAIETALDQDHDFTTGSTQTGKHDKVTFKAPTTKPSLSADEGALFIKTVSTKSELIYEDEDANEVQLTSGGFINAIRGSAKAVLRIIRVTLAYHDLNGTDVTISSVWNGDTLTATEVADSSEYYDFNVTGNCLGVLGVFQTSSAKGGGGEIYANARPWAAASSNNLRIGISPSSSAYTTFADILTSSSQSITFTVAYLTDA